MVSPAVSSSLSIRPSLSSPSEVPHATLVFLLRLHEDFVALFSLWLHEGPEEKKRRKTPLLLTRCRR